MQELYGKAVVEERTRPQHLAELSKYLHMEYGPGTGLGYLLAEMANGARTRKGRRAPNGVLRALSRAVGNLFRNNGRKTKTGSPEPTR